jgi:phenylacetate-coenzyme A ligase PaaK-like adenylate-forming protein
LAFSDRPGDFRVIWPLFLLQTENQNYCKDGSNLLVTKLAHTYLPLIRYEIGDLITPKYRIGTDHFSPILSIENITGRKFDILTLRDGSLVHGATIHDCIRHLSNVKRFQVVEKKGDISIRLLCSSTINSSDKVFIKKNLLHIHPLLGEVSIEEVNEIPLTQSGKHKFVIHEE